MLKNILLFIFVVILFNSCEDCEDSSAPIASIRIHNQNYSHAKGLGKIDYGNSKNEHYYPLSINSDTTVYVFYDSLNYDTLAFSYRRNFVFESNKCGFTVTLDSFKLLELSTFQDVQFSISEDTYNYPVKLKKNAYYIDVYN